MLEVIFIKHCSGVFKFSNFVKALALSKSSAMWLRFVVSRPDVLTGGKAFNCILAVGRTVAI